MWSYTTLSCSMSGFIAGTKPLLGKEMLYSKKDLNSVGEVLGPSALSTINVYLPNKVLSLSINRCISAHSQKCSWN